MNAANINHYWTSFTELSDEIRKLYALVSSSQNYDEVAPLKHKIRELQELSNISAAILPVYDVKRSQHVRHQQLHSSLFTLHHTSTLSMHLLFTTYLYSFSLI
jgi:hypothetical protein